MQTALFVVVVALVVWIWYRRKQRKQTAGTQRSAGVQKREERSLDALDLSDPKGECDFHIVGESNYQPELRRIAKSGRTFLAVVMLEPNNPRDPNAIRVCADGGGRTIGYLDRDYALDYHSVFALLAQHDRVGACRAKLIGGIGDKKSFGVMLNLRDPESLLVDIRDTLAPGSAVSADVQPF